MPAVFGPSLLPEVTVIDEVRTVGVSYLTDAAALEALIPYHFTPAPTPKITVSSSMNVGVDYMAGRSYNVVRAMVDVVAEVRGESIVAPYHLVIWESDSRPVIAGREFQGYAKVTAEIPDHAVGGGRVAFAASEYGTEFVLGEVWDLTELPSETIASLNESRDSLAFGWKYIPGPDGTPDADYATALLAQRTVTSASVGSGRVVWGSPTWEQCPYSSRIVSTLAALPVLGPVSAFAQTASVELPRNAVERIS